MLIPVTRIMIRLHNSVPTLGINGRQVDVEDLGTPKKTSRQVVGHTSIYFPSSHCCCLLCPQCFGHPSCAIPFPGLQWLRHNPHGFSILLRFHVAFPRFPSACTSAGQSSSSSSGGSTGVCAFCGRSVKLKISRKAWRDADAPRYQSPWWNQPKPSILWGYHGDMLQNWISMWDKNLIFRINSSCFKHPWHLWG